MVARATIWDAYRREQYEGKIVQRGEKGLTIEDSQGVRRYATLDRIVEIIENE